MMMMMNWRTEEAADGNSYSDETIGDIPKSM